MPQGNCQYDIHNNVCTLLWNIKLFSYELTALNYIVSPASLQQKTLDMILSWVHTICKWKQISGVSIGK